MSDSVKSEITDTTCPMVRTARISWFDIVKGKAESQEFEHSQQRKLTFI